MTKKKAKAPTTLREKIEALESYDCGCEDRFCGHSRMIDRDDVLQIINIHEVESDYTVDHRK